jgi:hypothetical protein
MSGDRAVLLVFGVVLAVLAVVLFASAVRMALDRRRREPSS